MAIIGEITLNGMVISMGGVKEEVLVDKTSDLQIIFLQADN